jgi:hypothetical protein
MKRILELRTMQILPMRITHIPRLILKIPETQPNLLMTVTAPKQTTIPRITLLTAVRDKHTLGLFADEPTFPIIKDVIALLNQG